MLELDENKIFLNNLKLKLNEIYASLKIDNLKSELLVLEEQTMSENFWEDSR